LARQLAAPPHALLLPMYKEAFWVAVSASAPVIALAAIVAMNEVSGAANRLGEWFLDHPNPEVGPSFDEDWNHVATLGRFGFACSVLNIVLQAVVLAFALNSLAAGINELRPALAVTGEVASLVALTLCAMATWGVQHARVSLGVRSGSGDDDADSHTSEASET
jgi:hypothetical protein